MGNYPQLPALHICEPRGGEAVFALMAQINLPDGDIIPRGFKTDGASIPRIVRALAGKFGHGLAEAVRHDWGYHSQHYSRKKTDQIYRDDLIANPHFPSWKAHSYYIILRWTGMFSWSRNAKRPESYFHEDLDIVVDKIIHQTQELYERN